MELMTIEIDAIALREPQDLAHGLAVEDLGAHGQALCGEGSQESLQLLPGRRLELPVERLERLGLVVVDALDDVQQRRPGAGRGGDPCRCPDGAEAAGREIDRNENPPEHRPTLPGDCGCS